MPSMPNEGHDGTILKMQQLQSDIIHAYRYNNSIYFILIMELKNLKPKLTNQQIIKYHFNEIIAQYADPKFLNGINGYPEEFLPSMFTNNNQ